MYWCSDHGMAPCFKKQSRYFDQPSFVRIFSFVYRPRFFVRVTFESFSLCLVSVVTNLSCRVSKKENMSCPMNGLCYQPRKKGNPSVCLQAWPRSADGSHVFLICSFLSGTNSWTWLVHQILAMFVSLFGASDHQKMLYVNLCVNICMPHYIYKAHIIAL